ncbi:GNAT family N-acetyltransferase [Pseudomonas aegrilactucae]|uniref:GNAT family N-acetyltransferase n=1 Tax=Pseudomonas aegrilactucae TaxID=2854028 RepID=A0A9Q2XH77_9PSED|nr:GNAT family N-acetyltransferase [Pseudomonas aegrilactucae]MBV6287017.1 GNAT family N-acetyltransferase [Pseudomonas aegrilactucae]
MTLIFTWRTSLCADDFPDDAYEQLRQRVPDATPFNSLAWLRAAEAALPPDQRVHVLLGHAQGRLLLCLPLIRTRERHGPLGFTVVRHLGYPLSDRIGLLIDLPPSAAASVLKTLRAHLPHALLQFNEVTGDSPWLQHWACHSSTHERRTACRAPVHQLSEADRQEVSGDPRYKLRRARKRIAACGAQVRRITPDAATAPALLEAVSAVEAVSWKGDDGVGIFSVPAQRQWMFQAFTALAADGRLRLVLLELDGRCISYRLGLLERGRLYDYNLAFVPQYADLGSGRVLLQEWIDWGLDEQWQWVDASRVSLENSSHQLHERMTDQVEHLRHSFYSWRPSGLSLGLALRLWQRLKPWLKRRHPRPAAAPAAQPTAQERPDAIPSHSQR